MSRKHKLINNNKYFLKKESKSKEWIVLLSVYFVVTSLFLSGISFKLALIATADGDKLMFLLMTFLFMIVLPFIMLSINDRICKEVL